MLTIKEEISLYDFKAWSGAKCRLEKIIELDKVEELEDLINELFMGEPIEDVQLNDFIWFELDNHIEELGITEEEWNS